VVTSVNRDDRQTAVGDLARTFGNSQSVPGCKVEVLIPDFAELGRAMRSLREAGRADHNTETVPRLYRQVRKGAVYERSLSY